MTGKSKEKGFLKLAPLLLLLPSIPLLVRSLSSHACEKSRSWRSILSLPPARVSSCCYPAAKRKTKITKLLGWVQQGGDWEWKEDGLSLVEVSVTKSRSATKKGDAGVFASSTAKSVSAPKLPGGSFRPKQSLGQNFMIDANTIQKIIKAFDKDATETIYRKTNTKSMEEPQVAINDERPGVRAVELGPGTGALTGPLIAAFGIDDLQCIEIDPRAIQMLHETFPKLRVTLKDAIHVDYQALAKQEGGPLSIIGNIPYYITTQILFSLADASHTGSIRSATVTMQWEVAQRIVAPTSCKDYGILSVVFQLYADCVLHFKIPRTVFYPQPKVDSALVGLRFIGQEQLRKRLCGLTPAQLRRVLTCIFQQRRKTVRNSLKTFVQELCGGDTEAAHMVLSSKPLPLSPSVIQAREEGDEIAMQQELPLDWSSLRPEQLSPGQHVEIARLIYRRSKELVDGDMNEVGRKEISSKEQPLGNKVWGKMKQGS